MADLSRQRCRHMVVFVALQALDSIPGISSRLALPAWFFSRALPREAITVQLVQDRLRTKYL